MINLFIGSIISIYIYKTDKYKFRVTESKKKILFVQYECYS